MTIKSKAKVKSKNVSKAVKTKPVKKAIAKSSVKAKPSLHLNKNAIVEKTKHAAGAALEPAQHKAILEIANSIQPPAKSPVKQSSAAKSAAAVKRIVNPLAIRRPVKRSDRSNQFAYMKAPGFEHVFEVGDTVEVFCDHEKNRERIRGWVKGIVVQVDNKMVAVQFRSNVYLTDGWMVPDRILWYPVSSEHIRPMAGKKTIKKDFIPDY